jgi:hypothetical protein
LVKNDLQFIKKQSKPAKYHFKASKSNKKRHSSQIREPDIDKK